MYYIGIDLGGTNIAAGVVDENKKIIGTGKLKTQVQRPAGEILDDIAESARLAAADAGLELDDIAEIGVGAPGSIDPVNCVISYANNLHFENLPFGEMMFSRLGRRVFIENDANAAAYGELLAGAGRGKQDLVAITLGTGVGGGVVIDRKIVSGFNHAGGELGHMVILMDGEPCTCGRRGCFEAYASATALIRQTKQAMSEHPESGMWKLCEGDINRVTGRTAFDGMRAGDKTAAAVVDRYMEYLTCGLTNIINIFQPEVLCVGGGIANEKEALLAPVRKSIAENIYSKNVAKQTAIVPAELGNDAGIIGAAFLWQLYK